jgi:two-component system, NarL family, nitrate/nitrite response regulator NarL
VTRSRILLIDDHPIVLQGVRHLLADSPEFEVVAESTSADEGVRAARREQPDLVVLDLRIADVLAPEVCTRLRSAAPAARVVILTAFDDEALLHACLKIGAAGVLLKDAHGFDLVDALRRVRAGEIVLDKRLNAPGQGQARPVQGSDDPVFEHLTPREHEVLRLMAQGLIGKEIAGELSLAPNTVRSYAQSVLSKLHASNRVQALATAKRLRLL